MTIVEHSYPFFAWASDISVRVYGDYLEIEGTQVLSDEQARTSPDPLRSYRKAVSRYGGLKRQGMNSPHVRFADAQSDDELVRFVKDFGPVVICSSRTEDRDCPFSFDDPELGKVEMQRTRATLIARQDMAELRSERRAFHAALSIVAELKQRESADVSRIREHASAVVESVSKWPEQWKREYKMRAGGEGFLGTPAWNFQQEDFEHLVRFEYHIDRDRADGPIREAFLMDPITAAHYLVCEVVNAFDLRVYPWGNTPVEAPEFDLVGGVRPILYYILRREYLRETRSIAICRSTDCRELFEVERSGQEFCSDTCSRLQRQREYWARSGKRLRAKRTKRRKKLDQDRKKRTE